MSSMTRGDTNLTTGQDLARVAPCLNTLRWATSVAL